MLAALSAVAVLSLVPAAWALSSVPSAAPAPGPAPAATAGPGRPTVAGNQRLARREARRLPGLADVPSGSTPVSRAPRGPGQPVTRSGSTSLVDTHPRPDRDTATGPRLRVTVAGRCPASDDGAVGVENTGTDLSTRLVPGTPPTAARVCWYAGLNTADDFALVRQRTLGAGPARRIAGAAAAVRLGQDSGAVFNCPADDARVAVLALAYPARPDVDLWFSATGCPRLANGWIRTLTFAFGGSLRGLGG